MNKLEERINEILAKEDWTFADLQNMNVLVDRIARQILEELSCEVKLNSLLWNLPVSDNETFGLLYERLCLSEMSTVVVKSIQSSLMEAKVIFENREENRNEISKRSMGGKSSEKRTTDETSNSEE